MNLIDAKEVKNEIKAGIIKREDFKILPLQHLDGYQKFYIFLEYKKQTGELIEGLYSQDAKKRSEYKTSQEAEYELNKIFQ